MVRDLFGQDLREVGLELVVLHTQTLLLLSTRAFNSGSKEVEHLEIPLGNNRWACELML